MKSEKRKYLWVEGTTWEEVAKSMTDSGMSPSEISQWIRDRRCACNALVKRLKGSWIAEARHNYVRACDDAGDWSYWPPGGLQPIDYAELRPILRDPNDLDAIGRAVLENRLVCDGHGEYDANWAVDQLDWCYNSNGQPIAPEIEAYGFANAARDMASWIREEQERREAKALAEQERLAAEAKKPRAVIAHILDDPSRYHLSPVLRKVLAVIGESDGQSTCQNILSKVWETGTAVIAPKQLNNIRTIVCRINKILMGSGYELSIYRERLYKVPWVVFSPLHEDACV